MREVKACFPMPYCKEQAMLITLGGVRYSMGLRDVDAYSINKNPWSELPSFPVEIGGRAATILRGKHLYNFGGWGAGFSVYYLFLYEGSLQGDGVWKGFNVIGCPSFKQWGRRDAVTLA